jgi:hypothetical protein
MSRITFQNTPRMKVALFKTIQKALPKKTLLRSQCAIGRNSYRTFPPHIRL